MNILNELTKYRSDSNITRENSLPSFDSVEKRQHVSILEDANTTPSVRSLNSFFSFSYCHGIEWVQRKHRYCLLIPVPSHLIHFEESCCVDYLICSYLVLDLQEHYYSHRIINYRNLLVLYFIIVLASHPLRLRIQK